MFEVGEHQFLMLLFVVQPQGQQRGKVGALTGVAQQLAHLLVNVPAIAEHLVQCGARQQTAFGTQMTFADAHVVGVEQDLVGRINEWGRLGQGGENKGLKEPGGMGQMPFQRAGVGHGLQLTVFGAQAADQLQ